jgi:hypothetical protein
MYGMAADSYEQVTFLAQAFIFLFMHARTLVAVAAAAVVALQPHDHHAIEAARENF